MLTRLYITRMLTRLESNLAITQSCGISYHWYSCHSIILVVTVLSTFLWHNSWLIFLSLYHSCGYSLVNILVRYFMAYILVIISFLWLKSCQHSCEISYSLVNILVRYLALNNNLAIGQFANQIFIITNILLTWCIVNLAIIFWNSCIFQWQQSCK